MLLYRSFSRACAFSNLSRDPAGLCEHNIRRGPQVSAFVLVLLGHVVVPVHLVVAPTGSSASQQPHHLLVLFIVARGGRWRRADARCCSDIAATPSRLLTTAATPTLAHDCHAAASGARPPKRRLR